MGPLEGWYDTEESNSPWKISGTFGGREWASQAEEHMEARHRQSSWIPTSAGRKRVHREIPSKTSSAIVPREQIPNMTGGPPLQHLLPPLTGRWNEQTAAVLDVPTSQPSEVNGLHATYFSGRVTMVQDIDTTIVDDDPSRMYRENYVSNFAARVLLTDQDSNGGANTGQLKITNDVTKDLVLMNGWDPRRNAPEYQNDKMLRNQETLFAADTSNANGRNLWSTRLCTLARDTGGNLPSARSVSSEGRQSEIEVEMEQSSRGEVRNLIPDRHGHMQAARDVVTSVGDHGIQIADINRRKDFLEQSQMSEFDRRSASFDTKSTFLPSISFLEDNILHSSKFPSETVMLTTGAQNSEIPLRNASGLNVTGGSAETLSTLSVPVSDIQPEQLALHLPTGSPLNMLPPANKHNFLDGSSESSQVPRLPLHLTPPLQHPPQPEEQMVEVHQSFAMSNQKQNGCLWTSPAFQENLQSKQVNGIGEGRVQQQQNSSWQQVITELEHHGFYKQPQQSLPHGSPLDMGIHGESDRSGSPDWTSNEAIAIQQFQSSMIQLDVGTRMCIRDALYRLAKSAQDRRNCRALNYQDFAEPDSVTISSCITGEGPCDGSRCVSETQTNHLDRSIANLLFSTGPFRKDGQPPAYKCRSVSQPLPGAQNGLWSWSSTGVIGNNWSSSSGNYAESLGVAPRMPSGNPLNSTWAASPLENGPRALSPTVVDSRTDHASFRCTDNSGSPDNYQPLDMQTDRLNISRPFSMRCHALSSANGVLNFDRSALPSQYTVIPEGMIPEGSTRRGHGKREIDLDIVQTFASGSNLVNINYQPALMPHTVDLGNDIATNGPSLQEQFRVVNTFHDGAGNLESKFPLESGTRQFTHPDEYGGMTVRTAGHMFGGDMNSVTTPHRTAPSGKVELSIADLWHDH